MKLYEIDEAILDCFDAETGEILDEERLNELQIERDAKIEGAALAVKIFRSNAAAIKAEIDALKKRADSYLKRADGYEHWLGQTLAGEKFETAKCAVSFRKSEQTVPSEDFVEWALKNDRDDLLTFGKPTVNKTAVKAALLEGEDIPAEIKEKQNISIK